METETIQINAETDMVYLNEKYRVRFTPGKYLILSIGGRVPNAASKFQHPNIVFKVPEVMEFKHYSRTGRKWWTSHPGIVYGLTIPKTKVELIRKKGYSYVPVRINGVDIFLNVTGGGGGDTGMWTDCVGHLARTGVDMPVSKIKKLAEVSVPASEVQGLPGYNVDFTFYRKPFIWEYFRKVEGVKVGQKFMLAEGWSVNGSQGPFERIETKAKRKIVFLANGLLYNTSYDSIDWTATAELNNFKLDVQAFNRLGNLFERDSR